MARKGSAPDPAAEAVQAALSSLKSHPLFSPLLSRVRTVRSKESSVVPPDGWALVDSAGVLHLHPTRRGEVPEWEWVVAHALLHLGFGHLRPERVVRGGYERSWNAACCVAVDRFLSHLKVGRAPFPLPADLPTVDEDRLASELASRGVPDHLALLGTAGSAPDVVPAPASRWGGYRVSDWESLLASGLSAAVTSAVMVAGGELSSLSGTRGARSAWELALSWFVSSYPLLGSLAGALTLVEDAEVCERLSVSVAAVSAGAMELYLNPRVTLSAGERRFVVAHELLHAGLRHDTRAGGRDPFLWNAACDFVLNGWLVEMGVGELPDGLLYDPALKGLSSEEVYDRIVKDARRFRKLATLRGVGLGDVLPGAVPHASEAVGGVDLDEFYRRSLTQGLEYHHSAGRGLLPAGLEQEIRSLSHPPVPWDVELARWFDLHFPALEARRSYARPSRRQASTPDIPRPSRFLPEELTSRRTFGVVLDTSGSMPTELLGRALGAIASYATTHDVPGVRVVFCDAAAYDAGYLPPDEIAGRVRVRGRGGTVLQPGVDLLESAEDFPKDGPVLVITDGWIDQVRIRRSHAFLVPVGAVLPFRPRGPVFRFS